MPASLILHARREDAEAIAELINAAFQVEQFFIDGDRTDPDQVRALLERGSFLLAEPGDVLAACVYVEIRDGHAYFGLLSVDPARQGEGLGRTLIEAAEEHARQAGCETMEIHVVDLRAELPPFYYRLGYVEAGREPFSDPKLKRPCQFIVMRKPLRGTD